LLVNKILRRRLAINKAVRPRLTPYQLLFAAAGFRKEDNRYTRPVFALFFTRPLSYRPADMTGERSEFEAFGTAIPEPGMAGIRRRVRQAGVTRVSSSVRTSCAADAVSGD
jgi:hypothetical protein